MIHFRESICHKIVKGDASVPTISIQVANNLQRPRTKPAMKEVKGSQNPGVLMCFVYVPCCLGLGKSGNNWN